MAESEIKVGERMDEHAKHTASLIREQAAAMQLMKEDFGISLQRSRDEASWAMDKLSELTLAQKASSSDHHKIGVEIKTTEQHATQTAQELQTLKKEFSGALDQARMEASEAMAKVNELVSVHHATQDDSQALSKRVREITESQEAHRTDSKRNLEKALRQRTAELNEDHRMEMRRMEMKLADAMDNHAAEQSTQLKAAKDAMHHECASTLQRAREESQWAVSQGIGLEAMRMREARDIGLGIRSFFGTLHRHAIICLERNLVASPKSCTRTSAPDCPGVMSRCNAIAQMTEQPTS